MQFMSPMDNSFSHSKIYIKYDLITFRIVDNIADCKYGCIVILQKAKVRFIPTMALIQPTVFI